MITARAELNQTTAIRASLPFLAICQFLQKRIKLIYTVSRMGVLLALPACSYSTAGTFANPSWCGLSWEVLSALGVRTICPVGVLELDCLLLVLLNQYRSNNLLRGCNWFVAALRRKQGFVTQSVFEQADQATLAIEM